MTESGSSASSTAEFERFVYADVAVDPNGMELSVLSALSRRGLDPWQEAERLAQLPRAAAAAGLAQTLRALPAVQSLRLDVASVADSLVALLPVRRTALAGGINAKLVNSKLNATPVKVPRALMFMMFGLMFGSLLFPLFAPKPADPIAPASWLAEGVKAPTKTVGEAAKPSTAVAPQDHADTAGTTTPPPAATPAP